MGMFDYYVPQPELQCPLCGDELADFQGKDGPNFLSRFKQGQEIPEHDDWEEDWGIESDRVADRIRIYTSCKNGHWVEAEGRLEGRCWVETKIVEVRETPTSPKVVPP